MFLLVIVFSSMYSFGQETLDASDPNSFIFGGDQGFHFLTMNLLDINLIDVEPEFNNAVSFAIDPSTLEAGEPIFSGAGGAINEDLWLNITSRTNGVATYNAFVSSNQPVPAGFELKVEILNAQSVGGTGITGNAVLGEIIISDTPAVIITGIEKGYTDDGVNKGFQLRYVINNSGGGSLPVGFEIVYELIVQN